MPAAPTYIVAWANFVVAVMSLGVGCIFVFGTVSKAKLRWDCDLLDVDCNYSWRSIFSLVPDVLIATWTPVILGLLATSLHISSLRQWTPRSNLVLALFMMVLAVFGSAGYTGMLGVITALLAGFLGIVTACLHVAGHKDLAVLSL
mmetsp:Transcript_84503/g.225821  ORF Transcript_84503/g.225821 Transcript_84503/m.225821 type:complete len:146 (+) Transcript_84503:24-461(+)